MPIIGKAQQAKLTFVFPNYGDGVAVLDVDGEEFAPDCTVAGWGSCFIVVSKPVNSLVFDVTAEKSPNSATSASARQ